MTRPHDRLSPDVGRRTRIPSSAWKMAVFVVVTVVLIGLLATLIGNVRFGETRTYYARFTDATGVLQGDRVRLSGVEVGRIRSVELVDTGDGGREALLELEIDSDVPVHADARLALRYENIVGQRYLVIEEEPTGEPMAEGGTFPSSQTTPALNLTELFNGFQPLLRALEPDRVNELSFQIVRAFQGEATSIAGLLADTASLTHTLADKDAVIGDVVANLNAVLQTVDARDRELTGLIVEFRDLMQGLSSDRDEIAVSLPALTALLEGTTDLVTDVREPLARTTRALGRVARNLKMSREVLETSLRGLPSKLRFMARSGSYGSWFNFYVCGIEIRLKLLGDTVYLGTPGVASNEADSVCAKGEVDR